MININTIFLFLFIFSIVSCLRIFFKFLISIFQEQPQAIIFDTKSLFFYGCSISYIITYLIQY
jgi:hypothetical protein